MLQFSSDTTALVIVDMQNDFVRVGGAMEVPDARRTIRPINDLIGLAREKRMPVIFTKFVAGPKPTLSWNWSPEIESLHCCFRNYKRTYEDAQGELECADIISEFTVEPQDYVFEKYGYSAFRNSPLIDILRANACDSVIITGTVTQICVADTVHDAYHERLKILVASDCVSSFSAFQQKAMLENVEMKYGDVATSAQILEMLRA